jgi:hypothetical protein
LGATLLDCTSLSVRLSLPNVVSRLFNAYPAHPAAIVTHKGADADAGHYIGFVKKSAIQKDVPEDNEDWYKFDDDKVSDFPKEKLSTLDGGGVSGLSSSSYIVFDFA